MESVRIQLVALPAGLVVTLATLTVFLGIISACYITGLGVQMVNLIITAAKHFETPKASTKKKRPAYVV